MRRSRFGAEQIGVPPPSGAVRMTEAAQCSAKVERCPSASQVVTTDRLAGMPNRSRSSSTPTVVKTLCQGTPKVVLVLLGGHSGNSRAAAYSPDA